MKVWHIEKFLFLHCCQLLAYSWSPLLFICNIQSTFAFKWWCCSFMAVVLQKDLCSFWRTWCVNIFRSRCAKWDCWYHVKFFWNFYYFSLYLIAFMQSLEKCLSLHLRSRSVDLRLRNWLSGKQNRVGFCLPVNFAFSSSHYFLCSSLTRRSFAVCVIECFCNCCLRTHQFGSQVPAGELLSPKEPLLIRNIFLCWHCYSLQSTILILLYVKADF